MIAVIRKRTLVVIALILAAIFTTFAILSVSSAVATTQKLDKTIVIDAGHGGRDGGVEGASGTVEAEVNLAIAKSLRHFFQRAGYGVVMTRENADGLYGMSAKNKKMRDMQARKEKITAANASLVISIHQNAYPLESVSGCQVFYKPSDEQSKAIASAVQSGMNDNLGSDRVIKEGDFYVLSCTPTPGILVECGFLSNRREEELLVTPSYQEKVAFSIFSAVHSQLGVEQDCEHTDEVG